LREGSSLATEAVIRGIGNATALPNYFSTISNDLGEFELFGLPAGDYEVWIHRPGSVVIRYAHVLDSELQDLVVDLADGPSILGEIRGLTKAALASCRVSIGREGTRKGPVVRPTAEGLFHIGVPCAGPWAIEAYVRLVGDVNHVVDADSLGSPVVFDFNEVKPTELRVLLSGYDGRVPPHGRLRIKSYEGNLRRVFSVSNGVQLIQIAGGEYEVFSWAHGYAPSVETVRLTGEPTTLPMKLEKGVGLTVLLPEGAPEYVSIYDSRGHSLTGGLWALKLVERDAAQVRVTLAEGEYVLEITDGTRVGSARVTLMGSEEKVVELSWEE
jgi:hypothetical protein